jgi:hypothetical protein
MATSTSGTAAATTQAPAHFTGAITVADALRMGVTGTVDHKKQQLSLSGQNHNKKANMMNAGGCKAPWTPEV